MVRTLAALFVIVSVAAPQTVRIDQVVGLQGELDNRPQKGPRYGAGPGVAVLNADGLLETLKGRSDQCVKGNATLGPCIDPNTAIFIDGEVPSGVVNGTNAVFTLSATPDPLASLLLYRNGLLQRVGVDFSASGRTVTFVQNALPQPSDLLQAFYRAKPVAGLRDVPSKSESVPEDSRLQILSKQVQRALRDSGAEKTPHVDLRSQRRPRSLDLLATRLTQPITKELDGTELQTREAMAPVPLPSITLLEERLRSPNKGGRGGLRRIGMLSGLFDRRTRSRNPELDQPKPERAESADGTQE